MSNYEGYWRGALHGGPVARTLAAGLGVVLLGLCLRRAHGANAASPAPAASYRCPDCNVLLISLDTLRADHLGAYGYPRPTSPNIDRFARESVLFENNINTGGGTLPVHVSMFTSLPPLVHGIYSTNGRALEPSRTTLAEQLRQVGYHTRGYTGGGFVRASFGLGHGFESFYDEGGDFEVIMPMFGSWLESYTGGKFFLFLHTYDIHSDWKKLPYDAPGGYNSLFTRDYHGSFDGCRSGRCASDLLSYLNLEVTTGKIQPDQVLSPTDLAYIVGLYDGGIAYVDDEIGKLFARLKRLGLYDKTLIVLTADHGEEFMEHNLLLHDQNYEEEARVPLIVRFPHGAFAGRRIAEQVSTLEVMPTILDVLDVQPNDEVQGKSVMPLILDGRKGRDAVYMMGGNDKLRTPAWSLLTHDDKPLELFDLIADPHEKHDLLATHPATAAALLERELAERHGQLERWQHLLRTRVFANPNLTPAESAQLRSLGYLQH